MIGGIFTGQLFGDRDEWNVPAQSMTFLSREGLERFLVVCNFEMLLDALHSLLVLLVNRLADPTVDLNILALLALVSDHAFGLLPLGHVL